MSRRQAWGRVLPALGLLSAIIYSCSAAPDQLLVSASGGEGTTSASDRNAFGNSARNLSNEERHRFEVGDSFFTQNWVTAPSSTGARDGLGPLFNAQSCSSCHLRDGRGAAEGPEPGLLFRLSVPTDDGYADDGAYGGQLQDRAVLGVAPEGTVVKLVAEVRGTYADGTEFTLLRPVYHLEDLAYGLISNGVLISPRLAPPVIGAGLLGAISEEEILAHADPEDRDGDGISGRPNYLTDPESGDLVLGRFGWKANVVSVRSQVASAFIGDIGITSPVVASENCTAPQTECLQAASGGTPEIEAHIFDDVVFYSQTLAVPARRDLDSPEVQRGAKLFADLGCASCHIPSYVTGESDIEALAHQTIYPFTDLLLHDMGDDLADDRPDGDAGGTEWRTPPLWGLGLTDTVNGHLAFLHDGRARSVEEAILWHGGEAAPSREAFKQLSAQQRHRLLAFLDSL